MEDVLYNIEKMPESYKGKVKTSCGYTKTAPREWTDKETEWVKQKAEEGYSYKEIAYATDRTEISVQIRMKRLKKTNNTYNEKHLDEKYSYNAMFLQYINPKTVCDVYCGKKSFYLDRGYDVLRNDIEEDFEAEYHLDALKFMCEMYKQGKTFDLIDLDPFGSAYDCFDLAVKMAKKGLVITFGEIGHRRWKRLDYVSRYYNIQSLEDFTLDNLIKHVQMIGARNKKILRPVFQKEWSNIARVYFEIEPLKITEQWKKGE